MREVGVELELEAVSDKAGEVDDREDEEADRDRRRGWRRNSSLTARRSLADRDSCARCERCRFLPSVWSLWRRLEWSSLPLWMSPAESLEESPEESLDSLEESSGESLDSLEEPGTGNVFRCSCSRLDNTRFVPSVGRLNASSRRLISARGSFSTRQSAVDGESGGRSGVATAMTL